MKKRGIRHTKEQLINKLPRLHNITAHADLIIFEILRFPIYKATWHIREAIKTKQYNMKEEE